MLFFIIMALSLLFGSNDSFGMEQKRSPHVKSVLFQEQSLQTTRRRSLSEASIPQQFSSAHYQKMLAEFKENKKLRTSRSEGSAKSEF